MNFDRSPRCWGLCIAVLLAAGRCLAALPTAERAKPFGRDTVRQAMQILKAECFACHHEEKKKGGLVLTSREFLLKGNDDGVVVVSGKPDASRLTKALLPKADPHMPPKRQLTDAQIKTLREWIKGGLAWDETALAEDEVNVAP